MIFDWQEEECSNSSLSPQLITLTVSAQQEMSRYSLKCDYNRSHFRWQEGEEFKFSGIKKYDNYYITLNREFQLKEEEVIARLEYNFLSHIITVESDFKLFLKSSLLALHLKDLSPFYSPASLFRIRTPKLELYHSDLFEADEHFIFGMEYDKSSIPCAKSYEQLKVISQKASSKNLQVRTRTQSVFLMGRSIENNKFNVLAKSPLSSLQAFALALSIRLIL